MKRLAHVLARDWPRLLIELVVLIAGITASFALEEWRSEQAERRRERRVWAGVRENLVADSGALSARLVHIDRMLASYERLSAGATDSLDHDMDMLITYVGFIPTDHGFTEIRESGSSQLRDRQLLGELSELYTGPYAYVKEWDAITRDFILTRMIPYVDAHAPFVPTESRGGTVVGMGGAYTALRRRDEFRNLVKTNHLFKDAQRATYQRALQQVRRAIVSVDSAGVAG